MSAIEIIFDIVSIIFVLRVTRVALDEVNTLMNDLWWKINVGDEDDV